MVEQTGDSLEVSDWESAIERLQSMAGTRQLLLAAVAICRELRDRLPNDDCRQAIEAVARLADHPQVDSDDYAVVAETDAAMDRLQHGFPRIQDSDISQRAAYIAATACAGMWHDPKAMIRNVAEAAAIATAGSTEGPQWDAALRNQVTLFQKLTGPKN